MPHFSIIMPLYNKAPYIRKAVESVAGQTYKDWELVVVDDGSDDGGGSIVKTVDDNRIRLVRQDNAGVSAARNLGVKESTAQWICFLDADDWWEPTFLEEMAGLIERHPSAGIYGTGYWIVKNGKKQVAPIGVDEGFTEGEISYCQVYAKTLCMPLTSITVCIPRAVFDSVGGFNDKLCMAEDFDLWIRIALKYNVVFLNRQLAYYNQDVNSKTRAIGSLKPPEVHFAFNTDYLQPYMKNDAMVRQVVEQVKIVCLKQYYLSKEYHKLAKAELGMIDIATHRGAKYSKYCRRPRWINILIADIHRIIKKIL